MQKLTMRKRIFTFAFQYWYILFSRCVGTRFLDILFRTSNGFYLKYMGELKYNNSQEQLIIKLNILLLIIIIYEQFDFGIHISVLKHTISHYIKCILNMMVK